MGTEGRCLKRGFPRFHCGFVRFPDSGYLFSKSAQSHGTPPASFRRLCRRLIPRVVPRETAALMGMAWWISRRMRAWDSAGIVFSALSLRRSTRYGFRRRKHALIAATGSPRLECLFLMPLRSVPYTLSLPGAPYVLPSRCDKLVLGLLCFS